MAVGDHAAGNVAHARYLEDLPHFDMAMELLANLRLEHAREALLQVIENLVNHAIRF